MSGAVVAVVLGAVLAVVGSPASPAYACSCALASEREHVESADLVVQAVVTDLQGPSGVPRSSGDPVQVQLAVERVDKGEAPVQITLTTAMAEASCGYTFQEGHRYLVYANDGSTGLCSGNQHLGAAPEQPALPEEEPQESRQLAGVPLVGGLSLVGLGLLAGLIFLWRRAAHPGR